MIITYAIIDEQGRFLVELDKTEPTEIGMVRLDEEIKVTGSGDPWEQGMWERTTFK